MRFTQLLVCSFLLVACAVHANLLNNGDFKDQVTPAGIPQGWYDDSHPSSKGQFSVVKEDGFPCVKLVRSTPVGKYFFRISQNITNVRPKTTYALSYWVKAPKGSKPPVFLYEFYKDGKPYKDYQPATVRESDDWQKVSMVMTTQPNISYFKLSLVSVHQDATVFYRDVRLENLSESPRCVVSQLASAPANTADWNAAVWNSAQEGGAFTQLASPFTFPSATTDVRFGIYDNTLHIIYRVNEPKMNDTVTQLSFWANDTVELFLCNPINNDHYHYGIMSDGQGKGEASRHLTKGAFINWYNKATTASGNNVPSLPPWTYSAQKGNGFWTAQFNIALTDDFLKGNRQFKILFCRSRKLQGGVEENSSWGHTAGQFFRDSQGFVQMALPAQQKLLDAIKAVPVQTAALPSARVIPTPKQLTTAEKAFAFSNPVKIFTATPDDKAFKVFARVFQNRFNAAVEKAASAEQADVVLEQKSALDFKDFNTLANWQQSEAYTLNGTDKLRLTAASHRGLVYAIASLAQLSATINGKLMHREATIADWPSMRYRGYHIMAPATVKDVPAAMQMIDATAALKLNFTSIQFDNRFKYERHPSLSPVNASTKDQHKAMGELYDLYAIDVIPMTQCLSHFNYFLNKDEFRHLAEIQNPDPKARWKFWNYCPRHPEIHKIVFDMIEEHLECYPSAKWYHVGMDETTFEPFGVCDRCKTSTPGELYAEEINRLYDFLKSKGKRLCMWGDQLLVEHNGGNKYKTAEALPKIPRDIIMFDWHYSEIKDFPSVAFFQKEGFEVMACGWFHVSNVANFIDVAYQQSAMGYCGTTWYNVIKLAHSPHQMSAYIITAEHSWNKNASLQTDAFDPVDAFRFIHNGETGFKPVSGKPVDISPWFNMSLSGNSSRAWMDMTAANDIATLPRGLQYFNRIPFNIASGDLAAIALANSETILRFPEAAWQIPVGGTCKALAFLHTTSRPAVVNRELYDQGNVKPQVVGYYIITYADGKTTDCALNWEDNIVDWNTQIGAAHAPIAWRQSTTDGALSSLSTFTWVNPRPDVPISAIDFRSSCGKVSPVLIAVTALQ